MPTTLRCCVPALVMLLVVLASPAASDEHFQVTTLTPNLLMLSTDQGSYSNNSLVFTGDDGVLLVDTHHDQDREALGAYVEGLGLGAPRYIITTHRHVEHIGGNAEFGAEPVIVAHHLLPEKLRSGTFLFSEYPPEAFPDITVADSLEIHFNGETIRVVDIGGSHDDNELMVHFTGQGIAHVSSVVNGFNFPSVDADGDVLQFESRVRRLMDLLPRDVRLVSGHHGHAAGFDVLGTWDQLPAYADMMRATVDIVRRALDDGLTEEAMQAAGILDDYQHYAGSYVSTDEWISYVVSALDATRETDGSRDDVCQPLYRVWKDSGATAAVDHYRQLIETAADRYDHGEFVLLSIGSKLRARGLHEDAAAFLLGSADLYPESRYGYYTHYLIARCHQELGHTDAAIEQCRAALRLDAGFEQARTLLSELTGEPVEGRPSGPPESPDDE